MRNLFTILLFFYFSSFNGQSKIRDKYNLMPWPKDISENHQKYTINKDFIIASKDIKNNRILTATTKFLRRLSGRTGLNIKKGFPVDILKNKISPSLLINFSRVGKLEINEDESYTLKIYSKKIELNAVTDIGIIRGLETLL